MTRATVFAPEFVGKLKEMTAYRNRRTDTPHLIHAILGWPIDPNHPLVQQLSEEHPDPELLARLLLESWSTRAHEHPDEIIWMDESGNFSFSTPDVTIHIEPNERGLYRLVGSFKRPPAQTSPLPN